MALGSGLDALFEDNAIENKESQTLRMSEIEPNKSQPRKAFDEEEIRGLAESIREHCCAPYAKRHYLPDNRRRAKMACLPCAGSHRSACYHS